MRFSLALHDMEAHMQRLATVAVLAVLIGPTLAAAQQQPPATGQQSPTVKPNEPSAQGSGAGMPGLPGSKSGPSVRRPGETTGSGTPGPEEQRDSTTRLRDPSNIPGQAGNKSGPPPGGQQR